MKNSASEIYCLDAAIAYQHAFGYIRQLAIHLRNSMKVKTKVRLISRCHLQRLTFCAQEAYKQVYNWQYVHSVDFWSLVLARACNATALAAEENELRPLIYPLVQVALGAIK
jgi:nucleolar complex protein 2